MRAGIAIDSLGVSQLSILLTNEINNIGQLDEYTDVIIFYHLYGNILKTPHFAMLQEQEMWGYDAPVMSTSIKTTQTLLMCQRPTKKFFYVWDLEWIHEEYNALELAKIYCHKDIHLIARSEEHAKIISSCWQEPVAILEDFNYEQFAKIIKS